MSDAGFEAVLDRAGREEISPAVALMELLIGLEDADAVADHLTRYPTSSAASSIAALLRQNHAGCCRIAAMLRSNIDTDEPAPSLEEGLEFCRRLFDWSVQQSEEASVALYSLGSPEILDHATAEIVGLFSEWKLLQPEHRVLQIGCGIGRIEAAIAPRVAAAVGVDVSVNMVAAARRRCAQLPNVRILPTEGRDLRQFGDTDFDLVYAVDSFPYIVQCGTSLVAAHFAEAARVLRPGGQLVILNYSYRSDPRLDSADVTAHCERTGLRLLVCGSKPFRLWNGRAFRAQKR